MTSLGPVVERFAEVNAVRLHYRITGKGSPVVLRHGYTQVIPAITDFVGRAVPAPAVAS